jgi:hypothetical protein
MCFLRKLIERVQANDALAAAQKELDAVRAQATAERDSLAAVRCFPKNKTTTKQRIFT